jgi:hypothetical protein
LIGDGGGSQRHDRSAYPLQQRIFGRSIDPARSLYRYLVFRLVSGLFPARTNPYGFSEA